MRILSFDVGIRNLAYVVMDVDDVTVNSHAIKSWDILELCDKDVKASQASIIDIGTVMMIKLDNLLQEYHDSDNSINAILIENQIGQNAIKMKTIQNMINMFFIMRGFGKNHIINYNAVNKLKHFCGKKKTTYAERKKMSRQITSQLCEQIYNDWKVYYEQFKKKDDLADCLLQAIDYLHRNGKINQDYYTSCSLNTIVL
jgi:hypothetical protein